MTVPDHDGLRFDTDPAGPVATTDPAAGRGLLIAMLVLLGINLYLLVMVVPKFKTMFDALKGELPQVTQVMLALSNVITNNLVIIVGILGLAGWFAFRNAARIPVALSVVLLVVLAGGIVVTPLAIFYPIVQLQSAVRGDQPTDPPPSASPIP